jgi:hypothetical protein
MSDISPRPFSIRLFLADGSALGLTIATIPNWAGSVLRCRNASLPALLARPEAQRPGVYVLQGTDPESSGGLIAYIGQGANIAQRLPQSARQRDFWEMAAVVTTSDANFSAGHFLALEAMMISDARAAGRVRLVNDALPGEGAGGLGEGDRAAIDSFSDQVRQVLPVLGFELLRPQPRLPPASSDTNMTTTEISGTLSTSGNLATPGASPGTIEFFIRRREGMFARAREIDGEFVVLEGSQALKDTTFATNTYARLRSRLITEGALAEVDGSLFLAFTRSIPFQSPSAAAAVVLDRNSNGRTEWKVNGTDETYDKWQTGQSSPL